MSNFAATRLMTRDEERVLGRLVNWERRLDAALAFFECATASPLAESTRVPHARTAYAQLKEDLKREWKRLRGGVPPPTVAEDRWYAPVIHEAAVHMSIPTLSRLERCHSSLEDLRSDFGHAIHQMRVHFGLTQLPQDGDATRRV